MFRIYFCGFHKTIGSWRWAPQMKHDFEHIYDLGNDTNDVSDSLRKPLHCLFSAQFITLILTSLRRTYDTLLSG